MRRLAASLLLVLVMPFLTGANGRSAAPIARVDLSFDFLSSATFTAAQAALPGITTPSAVAELGSSGSWRTPLRTARAHSGAATSSGPGDHRTRIVGLRLSYLEYRDASYRARTNTPVSYGNPPPTSPT